MNDNNLKIEITADGSATIFVENLNEHYHSVKGALAEAEHIYRDSALMRRVQDGGKDRKRARGKIQKASC